MDTGQDHPPGDDALAALAARLIEAHGLLTALPPDARAEIRPLVDAALMAVGRRIAAEPPPAAPAGGRP